jgi:superfamily I DNA/RNA helicase
MRNDREEAEVIASEIAAQKYAAGLTWENFAILYRTNQQSRPIEETLRKCKIPYRLIGGRSFFDRREIKDLLAHAACLVNPQNDAALLRILRTPPRGIGAVTVENALEESVRRKCCLFDVLRESDNISISSKARQKISLFCDFVDSFRIRLSMPASLPSNLLQNMLEESGYFEDLQRGCKTGEENRRREENIRDLLRDLSGYRGPEGLQAFLDEISLDNERQEKESSPGVTLITLHAVKGLEFPHVYLVGAEDGLLPHERSKSEGVIDEERRLFYVGITRAMKTLTISYPLYRTKYGNAYACRRSPFLDEIAGAEVVEITGAALLNQPAPEDMATDQFALLKQMISGAGQE